jgi:hypothetical protein
MPGLSNSAKHTGRRGRGRKVRRRLRILGSLISDSFTSDISNWSASTGASLSDGIGDDRLVVATGSGVTNAYGYREINCEPNVLLNFSIGVLTIGVGAEGKIWIGTSAGDNTHHSLDVTSTGTKTFTFTPTGSSFFISLVTTTARNNTQWDNLSITEA